MRKIVMALLLVVPLPLFAQEAAAAEGGEFWICPVAETAMFNLSGTAFGGGISLGYSRGAAIGLKAAYLATTNGLSTLELNFLFRWYFIKSMRYGGPFVQFAGGPVFFALDNKTISVPAEFGTVSAGLNAGWRFLLGNRWFIEPNVRAGYPFLAGVGMSFGIRN